MTTNHDLLRNALRNFRQSTEFRGSIWRDDLEIILSAAAATLPPDKPLWVGAHPPKDALDGIEAARRHLRCDFVWDATPQGEKRWAAVYEDLTTLHTELHDYIEATKKA
jgi:hypothetical protein